MSVFGPEAVETLARQLWDVRPSGPQFGGPQFDESSEGTQDLFRVEAVGMLVAVARANREHLVDALASAMRGGWPDDGSDCDYAVRLNAERYVDRVYGRGPAVGA